MTNSGGHQPPGWYHAHGDSPGTQRYWDGAGWVGAPRPGPGTSDDAPVNVALPIPRIGARLLDLVLWLAIRAGAAAFIGYVVGADRADTWLDRAMVPILSVILIALYEIFMVARVGATVGKMALGLKVVDPSGGPLSLSDSMMRVFPLLVVGLIEGLLFGRTWWLTVLGLIGVLALIVYSFVQLFTEPNRRMLWDRLANSLVVRR